MASSTPTLSLRGITKSFGPVRVLHGIDFDIHAGEVHCLMGENGAGKSTLIKIISGAYQADKGTVYLEGRPIANYTPGRARAYGIGTIYQELDLLSNLTAAENVFLGSEPHTRLGRIDKRKLRDEAQAVFTRLGSDIDLNMEVGQLNVAKQQIVAIAKAMVLDCRLLILDEPTAVFTKSEKDRLLDLVRRMQVEGMAILFISHHIDEIFEIGSRITILRDGVVASSGLVSDYNHDSLIRHMVGREIKRLSRRVPTHASRRVLDVRGLSDGRLVRNVSFHVDAGEIVGVAGLVGAGRTEMARLVFGADQKTTGEIRLHGRLVSPRSPTEALKLKIGMVPEDRKRDGLALSRPSGENLSYSMLCKATRLGIVPWGATRAAVGDYMQKMGVRPANAAALTLRLSGGNQQKLLLGRWMMAGLDVLILDEPTRGVDVGARSEIYKVLEGLRAQGLAILMVSSDLTEILGVSDRILVMSKGQITGELAGATATEEAVLSLALHNHGEAA